jgi:hypothetical protein
MRAITPGSQAGWAAGRGGISWLGLAGLAVARTSRALPGSCKRASGWLERQGNAVITQCGMRHGTTSHCRHVALWV